METRWEPIHNNFCAYWRATVFRIIVACLLTAIVLFSIYFIGGAIYYHPIDTLIVVGSIISLFTFIILAVLISEKLKSTKSKRDPKPESLLVQRYRAHKSKICPMVEYSNDY
jgi:preprotein translocase subunit SecF